MFVCLKLHGPCVPHRFFAFGLSLYRLELYSNCLMVDSYLSLLAIHHNASLYDSYGVFTPHAELPFAFAGSIFARKRPGQSTVGLHPMPPAGGCANMEARVVNPFSSKSMSISTSDAGLLVPDNFAVNQNNQMPKTNDLLNLAVAAHGALERWNKVKAVKVAASITGAIWHVKKKGDFLKNVVLTAETRKERLIVDFPGQDKRAIFEPDRIVMEMLNGTIIEARGNPVKSFAGQKRETPWDDIQVIYFVGEALWTYLNTPFLYTHEGFITEEIAPIQVEGETWRRLKVTFPDEVKSHTREQISCFGPDGLLRRHDYTVDILGGATGLNYASEYRKVDGIIVPTRRRVYAYEGDYQLVKEPLLVAIDMGEITLP